MSEDIDNAIPVPYKGQAYRLTETATFARWLGSLRDQRARARILNRLKRAAGGNFGDHRSVQGGVFEMRIDYGPGYRVYYFRRGKEVVVLLCGGDKRTQDSDIVQAKRLKAEVERSDGDETV